MSAKLAKVAGDRIIVSIHLCKEHISTKCDEKNGHYTIDFRMYQEMSFSFFKTGILSRSLLTPRESNIIVSYPAQKASIEPGMDQINRKSVTDFPTCWKNW